MKFPRIISALFLCGVIQGISYGQTTATLGNLTSVTNGQVTATAQMLVNISGTDYTITPPNIAKVVMSNLTFSPGLNFTGSSLTFTPVAGTGIAVSGATISNTGVLTITNGDSTGRLVFSGSSGTITLSSVLNGGQGISISGTNISLSNIISSTTGSLVTGTVTSLFSTTGSISALTTTTCFLGPVTMTSLAVTTSTSVLSLSNIGVGVSASTTAAVYAATTVSGREGLRIVSQTNQTANLFNIVNVTTGTSLVYFDSSGALQMRNSAATLQSWGTPGQAFAIVSASPDASTYFNFKGGTGIGFNPSANASGQDATTVCISCTAANTLQITNTAGARGTLATGGVAFGFRALSSSSQLTVTDGIVSLTGAITGTLPDATTLTGRMIIAKNIGGTTATISGTSVAQTLDGNTTLSVPASSSLRLISTGTVWISY